MKKLIPGRVRHQGLQWYEDGQVREDQVDGDWLTFRVADQTVTYHTDREAISCTCQDFDTRGYCGHGVAVERFLKDRQEPSDQPTAKASQPPVRQDHQFARLFLAGLQPATSTAQAYQLSVHGQLSSFGRQIVWTLKVTRQPDDRPYIIRDIRLFLKTLEKSGNYQLGKNYFEPLLMDKFDPASQAVIHFLQGLASNEGPALFPNNARHLHLPRPVFAQGLELFQTLDDCSLTLPALPTAKPKVRPLTGQEGLLTFSVTVTLDEIVLTIRDRIDSFYYDGYLLVADHQLFSLTTAQQQLLTSVQSLPLNQDFERVLRLDLDDHAGLAQALFQWQSLGRVEAPASFTLRDFQPRFDLDWSEGRLTYQLTLDYGDLLVSSQSDLAALPFASHPGHYQALLTSLASLGFDGRFRQDQALTGAGLYDFFNQTLPGLEQLGQVNLSAALSQQVVWERPAIHVASQGGLLEVSFDFSNLSPEDVAQARQSLQDQEAYTVTKAGQVLIFDDEVKRIAQVLADLRQQHGQHLSKIQQIQVSHLLAGYDQVSMTEDLAVMSGHLAQPATFDQPQLAVTSALRPYQLRGVQWLAMLDHYGFGGILADDMGLGKTLQTIAFLSSPERSSKKTLILAPSSLVYNWQEEFAKFYPEAEVKLVYGSKETRGQLLEEDSQVTITSYQSFRQDLDWHQAKAYDYLILDEAQVLKNSQTKLAQALRACPVDRCFALSGTPVENRLLELWSIFQLVLPGLFASKKAFSRLTPAEVARMIQPFVLRRTKEEVLTELPAVTELVYANDLTDDQKTIYLAQLQDMQGRLGQMGAQDFAREQVSILAGITRLRQICNSPQLFMPYDGPSGKLDSLNELLDQLLDNGHRPLIFSQFRGMLDLIEVSLERRGRTSYKLTGSTPAGDRQQMTKAFNKGSRDAFLISLKAGGVGLNLTGSDTVILVDLWWNPAVEAQAISRAHRYGQNKPVQVYRMVTKGTIEEKILALQDSKRHLMQEVLGGTGQQASLTLEDIKLILGLEG